MNSSSIYSSPLSSSYSSPSPPFSKSPPIMNSTCVSSTSVVNHSTSTTSTSGASVTPRSIYKLHGNLEGVGTFGQETLIGNFINNWHGTRNWGESLINNYNVGFAMHNEVKCKRTSTMDEVVGPFDLETTSFDKLLHESHDSLCKCGKIDECTKVFRRCRINKLIFHSLIYPRRCSALSYFVQYSKNNDINLFGSIELELFFMCNSKVYTLIHNHSIKHRFTDYFRSSTYHSLLLKALNIFFHVLDRTSTSLDYLSIDNIENMCVVFDLHDCRHMNMIEAILLK
ncbi:unnamed protein product [Rotaria magnacalcarata]|uniref:Uncharacterized protein n=1 Tax=Rotaria magnacalcarata TaxID=392030 RepID=A0A819LSI9_9BILA|nr:unnamed protein product [Rotaria magnacalcarata]CAF4250823.1 unnamed protein product [Rotaria magnacalcarata]